jgi:hypothetical protein
MTMFYYGPKKGIAQAGDLKPVTKPKQLLQNSALPQKKRLSRPMSLAHLMSEREPF